MRDVEERENKVASLNESVANCLPMYLWILYWIFASCCCIQERWESYDERPWTN